MEIVRKSRTYEGVPAAPAVLMAVMEESGIRRMIDARCTDAGTGGHLLSPGMAVKALIGAMAERGKRPLYLVNEYFSTAPFDLLFGPEVHACGLSDTAIADRLDEVFGLDTRDVLAEAYGLLRERYGFTTRRMFLDATNYTMYGVKYELSQIEHDLSAAEADADPKGAPMPGYGGNPKNGRRDLVQLNLSHVVDDQGIPICSQSYDGATSDVTMNRDMISYIAGRFDLPGSILMADCKLCTEDLLTTLSGYGAAFVTKVPSSFDGKLKESVTESVLVSSMDESTARPGRMLYETTVDVGGNRMRAVAYMLPRAVEDSRRYIRGAGLKRAKKKIAALRRRRFHCEEDAEAAFEEVLSGLDADCYTADLDVYEDAKTEKRRKDGRPFRAVGSDVRVNEDRFESAVQRHALQVLITNLPFSAEHSDDPRAAASADDVVDLYLEEYKVEAAFRMMKSGMEIGKVYIHTPSRISAVAFAVSLATMITKAVDHEYEARRPKGGRRRTLKRFADAHANTLVKYDRRHDRLTVVGHQGATEDFFAYIDAIGLDPRLLLGF